MPTTPRDSGQILKLSGKGQVSDISDIGGELNIKRRFGPLLQNGKSRIVALRALYFEARIQKRSGNLREKFANTAQVGEVSLPRDLVMC